MAAAYLRSPSPRHGYPDLHLSISRPSTVSTVSSHRAKLASSSAGSPAPSALQHSLMIALTTLKLRFFYHQSSAKLQQPYLCLVQLSLFPLKAQISDIRDIRGMSTHTPAAPSWVLLQNADHCSNHPDAVVKIAGDGSHFRFTARVL